MCLGVVSTGGRCGITWVLVVAGLGLIGPDLNCQGGSVSDCVRPASRGAV